MVGQMLKPKKTEITDKLRQEINKARPLLAHACHSFPASRPLLAYTAPEAAESWEVPCTTLSLQWLSDPPECAYQCKEGFA